MHWAGFSNNEQVIEIEGAKFKVTGHAGSYKGVNEVATEYIAIASNQTPYSNDTIYRPGVASLEGMISCIDIDEYPAEKMLVEAYRNSDISEFSKMMDDCAGREGFFKDWTDTVDILIRAREKQNAGLYNLCYERLVNLTHEFQNNMGSSGHISEAFGYSKK